MDGILHTGISIPLSLLNVVKLRSFVNRFFNPTCVPMQVSMNKLKFVPQRLVTGRITFLWNSGWLHLSLSLHTSSTMDQFMNSRSAHPCVTRYQQWKLASTWRILRNRLWHPRLVRLRSGNAMWMTPLVSHCFEQLIVFFFEKGY